MHIFCKKLQRKEDHGDWNQQGAGSEIDSCEIGSLHFTSCSDYLLLNPDKVSISTLLWPPCRRDCTAGLWKLEASVRLTLVRLETWIFFLASFIIDI